jgi:hypothetical protein
MVDEDALERRRRRTLLAAILALAACVVGWPIGLAIGGLGPDWEAIGGAFVWLGIAGLVAAPWIVLAWQGTMARRVLEALAAGRADMSYLPGEGEPGLRTALAAGGLGFDRLKASGLVEPFAAVRVHHALAGSAGTVPFALVDANLLQQNNGYRVFGGVIGSFRLPERRPGLTLVRRDRGLVGNLMARTGSPIERVTLEDPTFEDVFEAYGTDQVAARTVLTTTMLERLRALDEHAHARGFLCAFVGDRLLVALPGLRWRCPAWRLLVPVRSWLPAYRAWLLGLIELPAAIAGTLALEHPVAVTPSDLAPSTPEPPVELAASETIFSLGLFRILGEVGMRLIYIASGTLFGGLAAAAAWWGLANGYGIVQYWQFALMIGLGLVYGVFAVSQGVIELARFFWGWKAPLRGLKDAR